jgi:hypothetical protein
VKNAQRARLERIEAAVEAVDAPLTGMFGSVGEKPLSAEDAAILEEWRRLRALPPPPPRPLPPDIAAMSDAEAVEACRRLIKASWNEVRR